jgi:hypothetical protein
VRIDQKGYQVRRNNPERAVKYYFIKLLPPRADFMLTMSDKELAIMRAHEGYWRPLADKGWAVAYGPVADPAGGFGAGFWALPDDLDPMALAKDDPAVQANAGFCYEIAPMPALVIGRSQTTA